MLELGADLTVKCFACGNTYNMLNVVVAMVSVYDDTGVFVQYDVQFTYEIGGIAYLGDLLCGSPKRCSVFGRMPGGQMFAFPFLSAGRNDIWHSRPDSNGDHYAQRHPAQRGVDA
jgi:hypothetical protein